MWDYSDKVKEHFFAPHNAGVLENADATGDRSIDGSWHAGIRPDRCHNRRRDRHSIAKCNRHRARCRKSHLALPKRRDFDWMGTLQTDYLGVQF